jgi:hypothetical protein
MRDLTGQVVHGRYPCVLWLIAKGAMDASILVRTMDAFARHVCAQRRLKPERRANLEPLAARIRIECNFSRS